jgi:hypothetical protein
VEWSPAEAWVSLRCRWNAIPSSYTQVDTHVPFSLNKRWICCFASQEDSHSQKGLMVNCFHKTLKNTTNCALSINQWWVNAVYSTFFSFSLWNSSSTFCGKMHWSIGSTTFFLCYSANSLPTFYFFYHYITDFNEWMWSVARDILYRTCILTRDVRGWSKELIGKWKSALKDVYCCLAVWEEENMDFIIDI